MIDMGKNKPVELVINGKERVFDIDNPKLPDWIDDNALASGDYPYEKNSTATNMTTFLKSCRSSW